MAVDNAPIAVQVLGDKGYVWDTDGAKRLRLQHRIVGAMVGGVAQFKNQNSVGGLPLELKPNEVTLCLQKGWITLTPSPVVRPVDHSRTKQRKQAPPAQQLLQGSTAGGAQAGPGLGRAGSSRIQGWALMEEDDGDTYDDYYAQTAAGPMQQQKQQQAPAAAAAGAQPGAAAEQEHAAGAAGQQTTEQQQAQQQAQAQAQQHPHPHQGPDDPGMYKVATSWTDALARGTAYQMPLLPSSLPSGDVRWEYPATQQEQLSYAIFRDLHNKGFCITGGIKFGSEFLAYPGDPTLYHAQFTVRTVPWGAALDPVLLKSIARGSHAARKHLLLASMRPAAGGGYVPYYISVAPQLGFGHQNQ